jgi:hypothetical protein
MPRQAVEWPWVQASWFRPVAQDRESGDRVLRRSWIPHEKQGEDDHQEKGLNRHCSPHACARPTLSRKEGFVRTHFHNYFRIKSGRACCIFSRQICDFHASESEPIPHPPKATLCIFKHLRHECDGCDGCDGFTHVLSRNSFFHIYRKYSDTRHIHHIRHTSHYSNKLSAVAIWNSRVSSTTILMAY